MQEEKAMAKSDNNEVKCKICGKKFVPSKPNISGLDCGQKCPHCGIWTPIPFQTFRAVGGKIPGEQ